MLERISRMRHGHINTLFILCQFYLITSISNSRLAITISSLCSKSSESQVDGSQTKKRRIFGAGERVTDIASESSPSKFCIQGRPSLLLAQSALRNIWEFPKAGHRPRNPALGLS